MFVVQHVFWWSLASVSVCEQIRADVCRGVIPRSETRVYFTTGTTAYGGWLTQLYHEGRYLYASNIASCHSTPLPFPHSPFDFPIIQMWIILQLLFGLRSSLDSSHVMDLDIWISPLFQMVISKQSNVLGVRGLYLSGSWWEVGQ